MASIFRKCFEAPDTDNNPNDADNKALAQLGYEQELHRGFNYIMSFSFTFSAVSVFAGISVLFTYGLQTGGPVVMVWGWVVGATMTLLVACCMAEICSVYPQAGSVYYWAGQLGGERWGPFAAWTCGWFNLIGNAAGDASYGMGFANALAGVYIVSLGCANEASGSGSGSGSAEACGFTNNQTVGIGISGLFVMACLNIIRIDNLGVYNVFAAFWMMLSSLVIVIVTLAMAPVRNSGADVFTQFNNDTGFDNTGYVVLLGLLSALFSFSGYEAGCHMAEETRDAKKAAPKGIITSVLAGIFSGFIYIVGLLFAMQSLEGAAGSATGNGVIQIMFDAAGYHGGLALGSFLVITLFLAGISSITVTSRIAFAMVRDGAIPFSKFLRPVNKYTKEPIRMVIVTYIFSVGLMCTQLGSATAFTAVTSITTIGYQISYAIPIMLRVINRKQFYKGPIHLGPLSIPAAIIAATWLFFTSCIFIFPSAYPIDSENMNYACVMVGGIFILIELWWVFSARKWFHPKRADIEVPLHLRPEMDTPQPHPMSIRAIM